jgi:hypothetical protein
MFAAALARPSAAHAHLGHLVMGAERYLKLDAAPGEVRVVVSLMLGPSETRRALEPADTNQDDSVSRVEADAYLVGWAAELEREVVVTVDGAPAEGLEWRDGVLEPIGPIAAQPLTVEMVAHVPLRGGEHTICVRDTMDVSRVERTDVALGARDGATLLRAGVGSAPVGVLRALSFGRELSPAGGRVFTAVVRTPEEPTSPAWIALAALAVAASLAGLVAFSRARARASSTSRPAR